MRKIAIASTLVVIGGLALANPTADQAIAEAEALVKNGDFVGAAGKFKLAYSIDPRPDTICNVGVAYYKAKQLPRAQLFLTRCLERGTSLDAKFVDTVRAALTAVESALRGGDFTPIDIVVEPAGANVTIDAFGADESFVGSRVVWLPHGKQVLTARAEGYEEAKLEADAHGKDTKPVRITLQRKPELPATGSATDAGTGSGSAVVPPPPPPPPKYAMPSKVPALIATSVSIAAITVAVLGYQQGHARADMALYAITPAAYAEDKSSVSTWNTVMITGAAIGVASAGVAGYLWSRAFKTPVEVHATGDAIAISGRW